MKKFGRRGGGKPDRQSQPLARPEARGSFVKFGQLGQMEGVKPVRAPVLADDASEVQVRDTLRLLIQRLQTMGILE